MSKRKCHYEILGLERDASDSDIKKSYRKLALQWHPDKNPERLEECTKTFHLIQQAYEVLIDPQERAWYDKHREAILRGGLGRGEDYEDSSLDVFQYFSASCYSGFNDEEKGFYTVYRKVFETIAAEDYEYMDDPDSDNEIPGFGDSLSSYEETVGTFYGYWDSYCTAKSYVWAEKYDTREAPNRQVRRAMEQENKKMRDKAKRERNEQVRALVAFVKKRDKRVQAYKKKLEERAAEIHKKASDKKEQQKKERLKKLESFKESGWSAAHNVQADLEALEAHLSKQFGDAHLTGSETDSEDDDVSDEANDAPPEEEVEEERLYDDLYCVACNRAFKNDKAFSNHEKSKKHKENFAALKAEMEADGLEDLDGEAGSGEEAEISDEQEEYVSYEDLYCLACDKAFDTDVALSSHEKSRKHRMNVADLKGEDFVEEEPAIDKIPAVESEVKEEEKVQPKSNKKQKKRRRRKVDSDEEEETSASVVTPVGDTNSALQPNSDDLQARLSGGEEDHDDTTASAEKSNSKSTAKQATTESQSANEELVCNTCGRQFGTRNKLFSHLKSTGHALRVDPGQQPAYKQDSKAAKSKKKKGKNKN